MKTHLLACTYKDWSCSGDHASGLAILLVLGGAAVLALIGEWLRKSGR